MSFEAKTVTGIKRNNETERTEKLRKPQKEFKEDITIFCILSKHFSTV